MLPRMPPDYPAIIPAELPVSLVNALDKSRDSPDETANNPLLMYPLPALLIQGVVTSGYKKKIVTERPP